MKIVFFKNELSYLHPEAFNLHPYFKIKSLCVSILSVLSKCSFPWLRVTAAARLSGWLLPIPLKQLVGTQHQYINPAVQSHFLTLASPFKTNVTRAYHTEKHTSEGRCLSPLKNSRHPKQSHTQVPTAVSPRCRMQDPHDLIYVGHISDLRRLHQTPQTSRPPSLTHSHPSVRPIRKLLISSCRAPQPGVWKTTKTNLGQETPTDTDAVLSVGGFLTRMQDACFATLLMYHKIVKPS